MGGVARQGLNLGQQLGHGASGYAVKQIVLQNSANEVVEQRDRLTDVAFTLEDSLDGSHFFLYPV